MFDNKNNSLNNLESTNNQDNPHISNQPMPLPNLESSPIEVQQQTTSNINPSENIIKDSVQFRESLTPINNINQKETIANQPTFNLNTFSVNPAPVPSSSPKQAEPLIQSPEPEPEPTSSPSLTPHLEPSPKPVEPLQSIETLQPVAETDNLMKTEPLSTTLPSPQPLNEQKSPEVVPPPNDLSFINELNYVKTVSDQEINPYKDQTSLSSSILKQDITPKNHPKDSKKSSTFQVVTITIVALVLSAFIIATLVFNIHLLRISGTSMSPTITSKDWVVSTAQKEYTYGDIVAFYHKDVIMIKRIIALPGDTVLIDIGGNVYVNGELVDEPYIKTKSLGDPEVDFPHIVHPESYFVLGDNREDSIDSRNISIRDIKSTDIVGKVSYSIIPFKKLK